MRLLAFVIFLFAAAPALCHETGMPHSHGGIKVVSTTGIVNDVVVNVGGGRVRAKSLMGSGIDPHLYRATAGDIRTLASADIIFYHGLHLEGKISDVLEGMKSRGKNTVAVTRGIPRDMLIPAGGTSYDPHVWFDPRLWKFAVEAVAQALAAADPEGADYYAENARAYMASLGKIDDYARAMARQVPPEKRIIITSHDAFGYFGRAYGFKVAALQGVSTVSEVAISDVLRITGLIVKNRLPAIFTETSVSERYIKSVREAAKHAGAPVGIGGKLYSDALGARGSGHETLGGMFTHNVDVICSSLSGRKVAGAGAESPAPSRF